MWPHSELWRRWERERERGRRKGKKSERSKTNPPPPSSSHPTRASQKHSMVGPETHDWHHRYWRWQQPTRGGLPCATAAPPPPPPPPCRKGASQPCESDSVRRQLLDMFPRAKSGSLPAFELVFFLVLLSGCPQLTCQARTKGRWNKGGKWRIFGIWPEMCWTSSFFFFSQTSSKQSCDMSVGSVIFLTTLDLFSRCEDDEVVAQSMKNFATNITICTQLFCALFQKILTKDKRQTLSFAIHAMGGRGVGIPQHPNVCWVDWMRSRLLRHSADVCLLGCATNVSVMFVLKTQITSLEEWVLIIHLSPSVGAVFSPLL